MAPYRDTGTQTGLSGDCHCAKHPGSVHPRTSDDEIAARFDETTQQMTALMGNMLISHRDRSEELFKSYFGSLLRDLPKYFVEKQPDSTTPSPASVAHRPAHRQSNTYGYVPGPYNQSLQATFTSATNATETSMPTTVPATRDAHGASHYVQVNNAGSTATGTTYHDKSHPRAPPVPQDQSRSANTYHPTTTDPSNRSHQAGESNPVQASSAKVPVTSTTRLKNMFRSNERNVIDPPPAHQPNSSTQAKPQQTYDDEDYAGIEALRTHVENRVFYPPMARTGQVLRTGYGGRSSSPPSYG